MRAMLRAQTMPRQKAMPRPRAAVAAVAIAVAIAVAAVAGWCDSARAQIRDITKVAPDDGTYSWNMWPPIGRAENPEDAGREVDQRYRETLRTKIPDRKVSSDPWRSIRRAPAARSAPVDRHKVY
jgi:hypothetical protein